MSALHGSYEKELRIDTEENGWNSVGEINESGLYAKITIQFADHEDVTEFRIGNIYDRKQIMSLPIFVALAAALEVRTDELLYDETPAGRSASLTHIAELLDGCTTPQVRVIEDIVKAAKESFQANM